MTVEEAREKFGQKSFLGKKPGYVSCVRCPAYEGIDHKCPLIRKEIIGKIASGYDDCWEHIAKVMTEREAENIERETASAVSHPSHYAGEKYECIEVMREVFGDEVVKAFCLGNSFKYLWRCKKKHDNAVTDLKKARFYIEEYIKLEEGEKENGEQQTDTGAESA